MRMIKNVIFDLDGTLLDTREGIIESVKYAASELGYKELPYEEFVEICRPADSAILYGFLWL